MTAIGQRQRAARGGPWLDVRALVVFFVLAYALSWSWVIPLAAAHEVVRCGEGWPTHVPALLGPAIAAVAVTAWTMGRLLAAVVSTLIMIQGIVLIVFEVRARRRGRLSVLGQGPGIGGGRGARGRGVIWG